MRRAAAFALLLLGPAAARALQVELRDIQTGQPVQEVSFGTLQRSGDHVRADQYLHVTYPVSAHREVWIYTDNGALVDGAAQGGMVSLITRREEIPLYWRDVPIAQVGQPAFSSATASSWVRVLDRKAPAEPGFGAQAGRRRLQSLAAGDSAVHLGVIMSPSVAAGDYRANLVVEEVSDVPDIIPPRIFHEPFFSLLFTGAPITFRAILEDPDSQVVYSTFHYRLEGETGYTALPMSITPDPANPFRWIARSSLTLTAEQLGTLDYYFTATDGINSSTFLGPSAAYQASLLPLDASICQALTPAGGTMSIFVGDPEFGSIDLHFRPKSLDAGRTICARYVDPRSVPTWRGQSPVASFEFGPAGTRFPVPVDLSLVYPDYDQDGRVDGDTREESALRLFLLEGGAWRHIGGRPDPAANRVTGPVSHFSVYGLFSAATLSADMVRPAEKAFSPNGDGVGDFLQFNVAAGAKIEIFDVQGGLVRTLNATSSWDGRKDDGGYAETGAYVYRVEAEGLTVTGTVGVVR